MKVPARWNWRLVCGAVAAQEPAGFSGHYALHGGCSEICKNSMTERRRYIKPRGVRALCVKAKPTGAARMMIESGDDCSSRLGVSAG